VRNFHRAGVSCSSRLQRCKRCNPAEQRPRGAGQSEEVSRGGERQREERHFTESNSCIRHGHARACPCLMQARTSHSQQAHLALVRAIPAWYLIKDVRFGHWCPSAHHRMFLPLDQTRDRRTLRTLQPQLTAAVTRTDTAPSQRTAGGAQAAHT